MVILDTTSLIWSYGSTLNAPTKRNGYSATILTNGVIIYIGGNDENGNVINISQISLYDTNFDSWSVTTARNTGLIGSRFSHSAVLAPNGNIIIHGGANRQAVGSATLIGVEFNTAILNTQNTPFEWIVPTVSSNIGQIPSLYTHTANLVGNYMIVAFGLIIPYDQKNLSSKIYIMDIRDYTWIDTFDETLSKNPDNSPSTKTSTQTSTQAPTPAQNSEGNKIIIVSGVLGGAFGILFLSAIVFLGYKLHRRYKEKKGKFLNIPGSFKSSLI